MFNLALNFTCVVTLAFFPLATPSTSGPACVADRFVMRLKKLSIFPAVFSVTSSASFSTLTSGEKPSVQNYLRMLRNADRHHLTTLYDFNEETEHMNLHFQY